MHAISLYLDDMLPLHNIFRVLRQHQIAKGVKKQEILKTGTQGIVSRFSISRRDILTRKEV